MEKAKFNQANITLKYLQHSGETRRCPGYTRRTNKNQEYEQLIYERTNILYYESKSKVDGKRGKSQPLFLPR